MGTTRVRWVCFQTRTAGRIGAVARWFPPERNSCADDRGMRPDPPQWASHRIADSFPPSGAAVALVRVEASEPELIGELFVIELRTLILRVRCP